MTCTGCGSNNAYTGNCGCTDPIELICTGAPGAPGAPGATGADGTIVLANIENVTKYVTAGVTIEDVQTTLIDNTPTPKITVGGYFIIEGMLRYDNPNGQPQKTYLATLSAGALALGTFSLVCSSNTSGNVYFKVELYRCTPIAPATKKEFRTVRVLASHDVYLGTSIQPSTDYMTVPLASAVLDFTTDFNIVVSITKADGLVFAANEAGLSHFVITKCIK